MCIAREREEELSLHRVLREFICFSHIYYRYSTDGYRDQGHKESQCLNLYSIFDQCQKYLFVLQQKTEKG